MEGVALDIFGIVTLPARLHGGECFGRAQYVFAILIEQGKGRVEGRSLPHGSRLWLGLSGTYSKGCDCNEQSKNKEELVSQSFHVDHLSLPPHSTGSPG